MVQDVAHVEEDAIWDAPSEVSGVIPSTGHIYIDDASAVLE